MIDLKEETIILCADLMIENDWTVRQVAENAGLSKTIVHKYLTKNLKYVDYDKYELCQEILKRHKDLRAYRGGKATQEKKRRLKNDRSTIQ